MLELRLYLALGLMTAAVAGVTYKPSTRASRCSRVCPCYYQNLFCRGYNYDTLPSDLSHDILNIDFQDNHVRELTNQTLSNFTQLQKLLLGNNDISTIDTFAFSHQKVLNALDLSSNNLSEIQGGAFNPIRKRLEHLTLQDNNIYRIEGLFQKMRVLRTLNLKDNKVKVLTAETFFQNKKLRYLQLANNNITIVAEDAFRRQGELEYLFLDSNRLSNLTVLKLPSKSLRSLSLSNCSLKVVPKGISGVIRQLNMADNMLEKLDISDFSTLKNLDSIDLSRNKLREVGHRTFRHLNKLKVLYLGENRLTEVPRKLPDQLDQLGLDRNLISDIPKEAFSRLKRLIRLSLNNNMIEYIHKKAFNGLTELRSLDLSFNIISRLSTGMFKDLVGLRELDVSNNPIAVIESGAMDGLWGLDSLSMNNLDQHLAGDVRIKGILLPDSPKLRILNLVNSHAITKSVLHFDLKMYNLRSVQYLNLMQNNLMELSATFPQFLPNLQRIQLSNNPWRCTRDLYWMKVWLVNGMVEEPHLTHIYCEQPSHLRGRQLIDLDTYDWVSSDNV